MALGAVIVGGVTAAIQVGASLWGRHAELKERQQGIRLREAYNQSLFDLNENAIKASYARNVRANMLSENITMGRQATALAKSNIGIAGTSVPAFQAVMAKTDFDNQGYELNRMTQLGRIAVSRESSEEAYRKNIGGWGTAEWVGAMGDFTRAANNFMATSGVGNA